MEHTKKYLLYILIFSLAVRLVLISIPTEIWWDEAAYIGIGKYIFSDGLSGFMEYLRPIMLPTILGAAWKIGLDPITAGRTLAIIASLATIYMTYLIATKIHNKQAGIIAAAIISITYYFINFSTKIMTDIPSILLILIATNELLNKDLKRNNLIIAGITTALAILIRYTSTAFIIPIILGIIIITLKTETQKNKYKKTLSNLTTYITAFTMTLLPYFTYTYTKYGDPLFSLSKAITSVNNAKIYNDTPLLNIAADIITQNPILVLSIIGIHLYIKNIDNKKAIILIELAIAAISIWMIPIKTLRYTLMILPFLSITAGSAIYEIIQKTQTPKILKIPNIKPIFIIILALIALTITYPYIQIDSDSITSKENIYKYPKTNNITAPIITNTPTIAAYTDNQIISLAWPIYAKTLYENNKNNSAIIFINTCDLICLDQDTTCHDNKKAFMNLIDQENKILKKTTIDNCTYTIYNSNFYTKTKTQKEPKINPLWWDEAIYMGLAENLYNNRTYTFNIKDQERFRPPLYPTILATLFIITGPNETTPIYLNIIIALITAFATYMLTKELFHDKLTSIASAILIISSQQYIFWSSKILTEPLAILLTTTSLLIFTHITKNKKTYLYPLLGFILALSFLTRYPLGLLPIYFALYLLITDRPHIKNNIKNITIAAIIFTITLIPWMYNSYAAYNHPLGSALFNIGQVNDLYEPGPKTYYISNFYTFLPILGPLFTLGILIALLKKKPAAKEEYFIIGWFIITLILLSLGIGQKFFRYLLIALPSIAIISAMTLRTISTKITKKHASYIIAIALLAMTIISASSGIARSINDKENGMILKVAGEYIKDHSDPESGIMSENYALFHYYTKQPVTWYPKDTWAIDEFIKRYNVSYIIVDNYVYYPKYTEHYFNNNPEFTKEFEKKENTYHVTLYRYTPIDN